MVRTLLLLSFSGLMMAQSGTRQRTAAMEELAARDPAQAIALAHPDEMGQWKGPAEVLVEDDLEHGVSRTRWRMRVDGEMVEVYFAGETPEPGCDAQLTVRGMRAGKRIAAVSGTVEAGATVGALGCSSTGQQNIAVLLVQFSGTPLPGYVTSSAMYNAFFGGGHSLDGYWREASYGKTYATGNVFGPVTLATNYTCDQMDPIRTAAIAAFDNQVDFTQYNRIMIVMPPAGSCPIGYSMLGCVSMTSPSKGGFLAGISWLRGDFLTSNDATVALAAHEAGHTLGLNHAQTNDFGSVPLGPMGGSGTLDEYGDRYSTMGVIWSSGAGYGLGHYAAPHKQRLGWFLNGSQQTVTSSGTYTLQPYESSAGGLQALRVQRGTSSEYLWIEFRQPSGYDSTLGGWSSQEYGGALIHYETSNTGAYTQLLDFNPVATPNNYQTAALLPNSTWSDPYSSLKLTVNSASASGLTITVNNGGTTPTCSYGLSAAGGSAGASGGTGSFSVSTNGGCTWTAVSNASWLAVTSGASGNGSGGVNWSAAANAGGARTGSITVAGQSYTVTQDAGATGCQYGLSAAGGSAGASGGTGSFSVSTNGGCTWTAVSNASWLAVTSGASGNGSGSVNWSAAANAGGARTGSITVAGQSYTVTQPAGGGGTPCTYGLGAGGASVPAAGGSGNFWVSTNGGCTWTAVSSASWVTIASGASGNGSGSVNWSAAGNPGGSRNATITVAGQTFAVNQAAATQSATPSFASLQPFSGTGSAQTFSVAYADTAGWTDIANVFLQFNTAVSASGSCNVQYTRGANQLWLMNDAGTSWIGPATPGSGGSLQNSQCALNVGASSASGWNQQLTVTVALSFTSGFTGKKNIFAAAASSAGFTSDWLGVGAWWPNYTSGSAVPFYRLFDPYSRSHMYTTDLNEYNVLGTRGFTQEGSVGRVFDAPASVSGVNAVPLYRIYDQAGLSHFWTTDRNEYLTLIQNRSAYTGEGVNCYVLPGQAGTAIPFYRLLFVSAPPVIHHWTTDWNEYATLGAGGGWIQEGVAAYIFPVSGSLQ